MNEITRRLARLAAGTTLALGLAPAAMAASVLLNGGFEPNQYFEHHCYNAAGGGGCLAMPEWSGTYVAVNAYSWAWNHPGYRPGFGGNGSYVLGLQNYLYAYQDLNLGAGQYDFTLTWLEGNRPGFDNGAYKVNFDGTDVFTQNTFVGQSWMQRTVSFVGSGNGRLTFAGIDLPGDGTSMVDNASLTAVARANVPEPGSMALAGLGVMLLGLRRRRAA